MPKPKQQFCKNGHDTFITGRYSNSNCIQCSLNNRRIDPAKDSRKKQFCPKGHDKDVVGRNREGKCLICLREYNRKASEILRKTPENIEYMKNYRDEHIVAYREYMREYYLKARARIDSYKKDIPCKDCGVIYPPYVMDFDHRELDKKIYGVSDMHFYSLEKLETEIEKCDLVCANCHRERTHKQILAGKIAYNYAQEK